MTERYEMTQDALYIIDPELGLSLKAPSSIKEGDLHGPCSYLGENRQLLSITWYVYGKKQGKSRKYYASGALYSCERYVDDQLEQKQEYFYEDGKLKTLLHYQKGLLHGEAKLYWENGLLKREVFFVEGKRRGKEKFFSRTGELLDEDSFDIVQEK